MERKYITVQKHKTTHTFTQDHIALLRLVVTVNNTTHQHPRAPPHPDVVEIDAKLFLVFTSSEGSGDEGRGPLCLRVDSSHKHSRGLEVR